jgi:hypothetical protein
MRKPTHHIPHLYSHTAARVSHLSIRCRMDGEFAAVSIHGRTIFLVAMSHCRVAASPKHVHRIRCRRGYHDDARCSAANLRKIDGSLGGWPTLAKI